MGWERRRKFHGIKRSFVPVKFNQHSYQVLDFENCALKLALNNLYVIQSPDIDSTAGEEMLQRG